MEKELTSGQMEGHTMVTGTRTELKDMAPTHGSMDESTSGNGRIIICMAMVSTSGRMADAMKATTSTIRSTVSESMNGQMGGSTRGTGPAGSSTDRDGTSLLTVRFESASGTMENECSGLMSYLCNLHQMMN